MYSVARQSAAAAPGEGTHNANQPGQGGRGGGVVRAVVAGRALLVFPRLVALRIEHGPLGVQSTDGL